MGMQTKQGAEQRPLTWWQVAGSVLAAAFGVQSKENKIRDFSHGNAVQFAAVGIAFTAGFVLALIVLISTILT